MEEKVDSVDPLVSVDLERGARGAVEREGGLKGFIGKWRSPRLGCSGARGRGTREGGEDARDFDFRKTRSQLSLSRNRSRSQRRRYKHPMQPKNEAKERE